MIMSSDVVSVLIKPVDILNDSWKGGGRSYCWVDFFLWISSAGCQWSKESEYEKTMHSSYAGTLSDKSGAGKYDWVDNGAGGVEAAEAAMFPDVTNGQIVYS